MADGAGECAIAGPDGKHDWEYEGCESFVMNGELVKVCECGSYRVVLDV